jgi:hypothetical protein
MADKDGPTITYSFYDHLFRKSGGNVPDIAQAAEALQLAVKQLRDDGCSFKRWVPFIHLGL